ncbi:MAG: response regulator [bacterium]|nr:response regulator [bacterium]
MEDNPLIAFHLEQMIEDLGHVFAGSLESFTELQALGPAIAMDVALVDIDLADGPTGPSAVAWLAARGIPAIFVSGQEAVASQYGHLVVGVVTKPVDERAFADALQRLRDAAKDV